MFGLLPGIASPSSRMPLRCSLIEPAIRSSTSSSVFPTATHPGRSGTEAPNDVSPRSITITRKGITLRPCYHSSRRTRAVRIARNCKPQNLTSPSYPCAVTGKHIAQSGRTRYGSLRTMCARSRYDHRHTANTKQRPLPRSRRSHAI